MTRQRICHDLAQELKVRLYTVAPPSVLTYEGEEGQLEEYVNLIQQSKTLKLSPAAGLPVRGKTLREIFSSHIPVGFRPAS